MIDMAAPREDVRRALLTLLVMPDREARWLRRTSSWSLPTIDDAHDAYGSRLACSRFAPTAHDVSNAELIAPALARLRQLHGEGALRLLTGWALGVPAWREAQRLNVTGRTVRNRVERLLGQLLALVGASLAATIEPEPMVEPVAYGSAMAAPPGSWSGTAVMPTPVWVGQAAGGQLVVNGKRWRPDVE
jgi:hypothetical protein